MKQQKYEAGITRSEDSRGTHRSEEVFFSRDSLLRPGEEPALASHLVTPRMLYNHHGIYVGNGCVIHYAGLAHGLRRGPVEEVSIERFARGHEIRVRHEPKRLDHLTVVQRARSRLGERRYHILTNNCVHFCAWALGRERRQLERLRIAMTAIYRAVRPEYQRTDPRHGAIA